MSTEQETEAPKPDDMNARMRAGGKPTAEDRHAGLFRRAHPDTQGGAEGEVTA